MNIFLWILLCLAGLCWGSFLNVLIVRTLSGESIIFPGSKCPKCNTPLKWWQNIPIFSYFYLKGKCWWCGRVISTQYPIIEFIGLCIVLFAFITNISKVDAISVVMILSMFLVLSVTDTREKKVSILQTFVIIIFGLIFNRHDVFNSISGGLIAGAALTLIMLGGLKYLNKETFGVGDIYLLASLGFVVGIDKLYLFLIYALIAQFLIILPKYIVNLIRTEQQETLKYLIFFMTSCLFLYLLRNHSSIGSNIIMTILLGFILYFAYKITRNTIKTINTTKTPSYSPFAPAIALSCLLFFC